MGRKLRHLLIFLLIILKEPNLQVAGWWKSAPKADCKCEPSPRCDCRDLGLTSIPKSLPKSICRLDLSVNKIKEIQSGAFANLLGLGSLVLSNNQIAMLQPGTFANLHRLGKLVLSNNQVRKIPPDTFSNLTRLQLLYLSQNQITKIQPGLFANLLQLKELYLSDNQLTKIQPGTFANLPRLENLVLASNQIKMILPGLFSNLPQLKRLCLSYNQLTKIQPSTFANLPKLEKLDLAVNQITMIQEGAYPRKIQHLDLRGNKISAITPLAYGLLKSIPLIKLDRNPWQCDCRMLPFRLNITDFPSFEDQIICAPPSKFLRQKLADINPEELICEEPTESMLHVEGRVNFKNCNNCTTGGSAVDPADKTRTTLTSSLATTPENTENSSSYANVKVSSTNSYNGTTADSVILMVGFYSTVGTAEKASKTRVTLNLSPATTPEKNESSISLKSAPRFPIPVLIGCISGSLAGFVFIGTIIVTIWFNRKAKNPPSNPSGSNSNIALSNLNTTATAVTSGNDQTGQGQSQAIADDKSLPPPHGDDDCVYVQPDGAMYMTPEDVLYEMPANSQYNQPVGTNDNLHYYKPQTEDTPLPTDDDGYIIVAPRHTKGH